MCCFVLVITPPSGSQRFTDCVSLNFISLPLPVQANPDTRFWTETLASCSRPRVEPPAVEVVYFYVHLFFSSICLILFAVLFVAATMQISPKLGLKKAFYSSLFYNMQEALRVLTSVCHGCSESTETSSKLIFRKINKMIKVLSKVTTVTFNFITKQDFQNYQYNNISTQNEQKNREEGPGGGA